MAFLLFSLRGVPEEEAFEIRDLLTHHEIDFYETNAGNWGVSMPALWLKDEFQVKQAQQLLQEYHQYRYRSQREAYLEKKIKGEHKTLWQSFWQSPSVFGGYLLVIGLILYVSIKLLFEFGL
ncbi:MAG: hypothetical protein KAH08_01000 [Methylococcales bacterium]|nr:hypothetical protein [Methylococcales bacterium]